MSRSPRPRNALQPIVDRCPDSGFGAASTVLTLLRRLTDACHDASVESELLHRENSALREQLHRFTASERKAVKGVRASASSIKADLDLVILTQDEEYVASHEVQAQRGHRKEHAGLKPLQEETPSSMALDEAPVAEDQLHSSPTTPRVNGSALRSPNGSAFSKSSTSLASAEHQLQTVWDKGAVGDNSLYDLATASVNHMPQDMAEETCVEASTGYLQSLISFPGSPRRNVWDMIGFVFILYDMVVIPLQPFAPPDTWVSVGMEWIVLLFWTVNVLASVQVGYVERGITIMSPRKILRHYLKKWFWLDVAVLVPDWYFTLHGMTAASDSNSPEDAVKLLRMARLTKCLRLLRAAKLKTLMRSLQDRISSEFSGIVFKICKMVFVLLLLNHYIASFWFAIGSMESFGRSWVTFYYYDSEDWFTKYCVSLHWSLTQFTPASKVDVQPKNIFERCYAVCVVVFALVGFSYMLGSINCALAQLRAMGEDAEKQFWQVRRYFRQNSVSTQLGARILRYLEHAYAKTKSRIDVNKIRIFDLLSENLRSELRMEIALPQLKAHPLFVQLSLRFMPTLRRISTTCVSYRSLAVEDVLFFSGEHATHLYFMVSGLLQYTLSRSRVGETAPTELVEGREDWIAEPVLWLRSWYHRGTPVAVVESEILLVNPVSFSETVVMNPAAFEVVSSYALGFVDWLTNKHQSSWSDIYQGEDLFEEFAGFCNLDRDQIEANMPRHANQHFALCT